MLYKMRESDLFGHLLLQVNIDNVYLEQMFISYLLHYPKVEEVQQNKSKELLRYKKHEPKEACNRQISTKRGYLYVYNV